MLPAGSAPPFWVVLSAGPEIGLGTYMGDRRIIRRLSSRVGDIRPVPGLSAETTGAAVVLTSTHLALPRAPRRCARAPSSVRLPVADSRR